MQARLTRSRHDRMIAGVCGGLGQYFGVDPVIVRLIFVVLAITTFVTPLLYPLLWLIMPEQGSVRPDRAVAPLPPDARFDPMTGEPLPPRSTPVTGQTVNLGESGAPQVPPSGRNRTLGYLLLGIGGVLLLNTIGEAFAHLFGMDLSGLIFPLLLVGVGVYLLRRKVV